VVQGNKNDFIIVTCGLNKNPMKLLAHIKVFFLKYKSRPSLFSRALSEGIRDMFEEMGYPVKNKKD